MYIKNNKSTSKLTKNYLHVVYHEIYCLNVYCDQQISHQQKHLTLQCIVLKLIIDNRIEMCSLI